MTSDEMFDHCEQHGHDFRLEPDWQPDAFVAGVEYREELCSVCRIANGKRLVKSAPSQDS